MVKFVDGEKKPTWVPLRRLEGMVPEAVCPAMVMLPVDPVRVTVRGAPGVPVQMVASLSLIHI